MPPVTTARRERALLVMVVSSQFRNDGLGDQLDEVAICTPRRSCHADLACAVARRVGAKVVSGKGRGLGGGRCGGEFGMQQPAVARESATRPVVGHYHVVRN